jgi:DNA replication protein DnaC
MLHTQTIDKMNQMKLHGMLESLQNLLAHSGTSGTQDLGTTELFGLAIDAEWTYRENQKTKRLVTGAHFKEKTACIEALDYRAGRGLKKSVVTELTQNHWITGHQNIVITGPAGSGKSFLAQALGHHAARFGFSVQYLRMPKLLFSLLQSRADGSYLNLLKRLGKTQILILDDWGLTALGEQERQDLLEIIEDRHQLGSTIVTSQLPVSAWHTYLGGSLIADSILDRLVNLSQRIDLRTEESRRKEAPSGSLTQSDKSAN